MTDYTQTIFVYHDPNDCCFDTSCQTCGGYIYGWTQEPVEIGDEVTVEIWGDSERRLTGYVKQVKDIEYEGKRERQMSIGISP